MTPGEIVGLITGVLGTGGLGAALRWAVRLWAQVRREAIAAEKDRTGQQRADTARMVDALIANARGSAELAGEIAKSNAILSGKLDTVTEKIDALVEWRERTPVEGFPLVEPPPTREPSERRTRTRTPVQSPTFRPARPGTHHDE